MAEDRDQRAAEKQAVRESRDGPLLQPRREQAALGEGAQVEAVAPGRGPAGPVRPPFPAAISAARRLRPRKTLVSAAPSSSARIE
ncbi:hypothetical protein [Aromatoleum evansii]|uniref:hypothetical protein n=1 Tax=Aromatoleum evansii TaxID=59406 RepID=UPI00145E812A|nr:hypothetical protein [Aromatoleum evansii]NMG31329.1 hypothetical protein [Aromatoleum evansii]